MGVHGDARHAACRVVRVDGLVVPEVAGVFSVVQAALRLGLALLGRIEAFGEFGCVLAQVLQLPTVEPALQSAQARSWDGAAV